MTDIILENDKFINDKNVQFLSIEQLAFVKSSRLPAVLNLPRAGEFDDKDIYTCENTWLVNSGGKLHSFVFSKKSNHEPFNQFIKLYLSKFIRMYSVEYSYFLFRTLMKFVLKGSELTPSSLRDELEFLTTTQSNNTVQYYVLKRLYSMLIEDGFPHFEP